MKTFNKKYSVRIVSALVGASMLFNITSCSTEKTTESVEETIKTERVLPSGISIETNPYVEETSKIDDFSEYIYVPTRELSACDFDVDNDTHKISAHYDDSDLYGEYGIAVDYDLFYEDYGVTEVAVYRAERSNSLAMHNIDLEDTNWIRVNDPSEGVTFASIDVNNQERMDISFNAALSFSIEDIDSNEAISDLATRLEEYYLISSNLAYFDYPLGRVNQLDVSQESFRITDANNFYDYGSEVTSDVREYYLRSYIDRLPVGSVSEAVMLQLRVFYGDYFGSFFGIDDSFTEGFFLEDEGIFVNFISYNYENYEVEGDVCTVVPLEECIDNSLYGVLRRADGASRANVYAAELIYVPLAENSTGFGDFSYDVLFVPVWALYIVYENSNGVQGGEVFLNAMTGELVGHGI